MPTSQAMLAVAVVIPSATSLVGSGTAAIRLCTDFRLGWSPEAETGAQPDDGSNAANHDGEAGPFRRRRIACLGRHGSAKGES